MSDYKAKMHHSVRAPPQILLGELTALSRPPAAAVAAAAAAVVVVDAQNERRTITIVNV